MLPQFDYTIQRLYGILPLHEYMNIFLSLVVSYFYSCWLIKVDYYIKHLISVLILYYHKLGKLKQYPPINCSSVCWKSRWVLAFLLRISQGWLKILASLGSYLEDHGKNLLPSSLSLLAEPSSLCLWTWDHYFLAGCQLGATVSV